MGTLMFTVYYSETGSGTGSPTPYVILPPKNPVLHSYLKEEQANLYRYDYTAQFNQDAALNYFVPSVPGYYQFKIEATDAAGNKSSRTLDLHAVATGTSLGSPVDGPPRIDAIFPEDKSKDVMVTTQIVATFNEPVQNVESNFKLYDTSGTTPVLVPAKIITSIEAGRMQATLIPNGNLYYARNYKIVLSTGITDTAVNTSTGAIMPLTQEYSSTFTTKVPVAYDLGADQQFTGGRSIDLYTFTDVNGESDTYAYITTHDKGWKISDVTDPTDPGVIFTASPTCASGTGATPDCRYISPYPITYFRGLAVHPDNNKALLAITENIVTPDASISDGGSQFGYIRFYDLSTDPGNPPIIGMERLDEAYSGIPGRVAMWGDYAVVNSAVSGIRIVNIQSAIKRRTGQLQGYGIAIAGTVDTEGQGYGSPYDLAIFNEHSAVFTTSKGHLLTVDLNLSTDQQSIDNNEPVFPALLNAFKPSGYNFSRVATATGYPYTDTEGNEQTINLAVAGTREGTILTLDLTDPNIPKILGIATKADGTQVTAIASDITVSKDAGLAIVTTYNAIQVYDIKDPTKPRLLNEITSLPDPSGATNPNGTPVMIPIGETPGIVEKGGWVYLANMTKGMRTLDLDPPDFDIMVLKNNQIYTGPIKITNDINGQPKMPTDLKFEIVSRNIRTPIQEVCWDIKVEYFVTVPETKKVPKAKKKAIVYDANGDPMKSSKSRKGLATGDGFQLAKRCGPGLTTPLDWGTNFGGGKLNVKATVSKAGSVTSGSKEIYVQGETNSENYNNKQYVTTYLEKPVGYSGYNNILTDVGYNLFFRVISYHESAHTYDNFETLTQAKWPGMSPLIGYSTDVVYPKVNKSVDSNKTSYTDGGFGLMQLTDPNPSYAQIWNYKENINGGIAHLAGNLATAKAYPGTIQTRGCISGKTRNSRGKIIIKCRPIPDTPVDGDATAFTSDQLRKDVYSLYNAYWHYWKWEPDKRWQRYPTAGATYADNLEKLKDKIKAGTPPSDF